MAPGEQPVAPEAPVAPAATGRYKAGVAFLNGKMVELRQDEQIPLQQTFTASDGTQVSPDGLVRKPDGSTRQLREGKAVNMEGRIVNYHDDMFTTTTIQQQNQKHGVRTETIIIQRNDSVILRTPEPRSPKK